MQTFPCKCCWLAECAGHEHGKGLLECHRFADSCHRSETARNAKTQGSFSEVVCNALVHLQRSQLVWRAGGGAAKKGNEQHKLQEVTPTSVTRPKQCALVLLRRPESSASERWKTCQITLGVIVSLASRKKSMPYVQVHP